MDILVIQSSEDDPIGLLGEFLEAKGARLHPWLPLQQAQVPVASDYQSLIVLGGSMHAGDDSGFPHLR
ncbi:MAG: hypothetical protein WBA10_19640, partial [Elainellaceae cyanobacterium]